MALACKYCIAKYGLRGRDIHQLPQTEEQLFDHIEREHHMPVQREGETKKQAIKRFLKSCPEAAHCQECRDAGASWAQP